MSEISSTSELTTKEIVEQAIQDYHETILPYLNGQVPVIANKFDKANLYSTDEQIVGRWIDGKPLYQKTMVKTYNDNFPTGDMTIILGDDNFSDVDWIEVKTFYGLMKSGSYIDLWAMNYYLGNTNYQISKFTSPTIDANTGKLNIYAPSVGAYYKSDTTYGVTKTFATIQYTKTTDEAIAIGSDTDYSTTEKIVGTWIDGKPLYQKTVTGTTAAINTDGLLDTINDLDEVISSYGYILRSNGRMDLVPRNDTSIAANTNKITIYTSNSSLASRLCKITLQYTKTSD